MKKKIYFIFTQTIGTSINLLSFIHKTWAVNWAIRLFSQPRQGKLNRQKMPEILAKSNQIRLKFNQIEFQTYHWKGASEQVILLLHGWESNSSRWEKTLAYLQQTSYTIIAIDAPAHGLSESKLFNVPAYSTFVDYIAQHHELYCIIGHSMGGQAALYYQKTYQNSNVKKIATLGAPSEARIIFNNYIKLLTLNAKISQGIESHYEKIFKMAVDDFNSHLFVLDITSNGLIIHDKKDKIVNHKEALKIATNWKKSELITTSKLGHSLHDKEVYEKLIDFIQS
jgi:esterase/lipase